MGGRREYKLTHQIARAQNVVDSTRNEQFLELARQTVASVWDVQVPEHEYQLKGWVD